MILILTNNELSIGIKDIRTIIGRIYKGTESDRSNSIIDFGLNNKSVNVIYYTFLRSIILNIKNIK